MGLLAYARPRRGWGVFGLTPPIWNCGLPDVLMVRHDGDVTHRTPQWLPSCIIEQQSVDFPSATMEPALIDQVLVYSDGVIESTNPEGEIFGQLGLERCLAGSQHPDTWLEEIAQILKLSQGCASQQDDISIIQIVT